MWIALMILGGLFVAMMAAFYLEYENREQQRAKEAEGVLAGATIAKAGHCMLCDAPLRRTRTTAEVVFEIEHRIDAELQDIHHLLRTAPEKVNRLYLA
jgi:hypothetical protein